MAAFVAACRAEVLSERTIEFYLEGLNAYRTFAGADDRHLTLADVDLGVARAWLADYVERGRKPATVAARAPASLVNRLSVMKGLGSAVLVSVAGRPLQEDGWTGD